MPLNAIFFIGSEVVTDYNIAVTCYRFPKFKILNVALL